MTPLDLVKLPRLMDLTAGRSDITVGLIDGPVAVSHSDLAGENIREIPGAAAACAQARSAACLHGTFVASILCARRGSAAPAICPACTLLVRPHPEGGHFRETFRDPVWDARGRAVSTLIYYLLGAGQLSRWHKVDAAEVWHYYAGAALEIKISQTGVETGVHRLGPDLIAGERPQFAVPAHCWQSAKSLGRWTLVGCSVAPGFEFSGFELAPLHWSPAETG
jgi:predicted cupin superfamily sugar epimerase